MIQFANFSPDLSNWTYLLSHFPDWDYNNCLQPQKLDYSHADNLVGEQQECFRIYWALYELHRKWSIGIDIGCGQVITPGTIGIDYYGKNDEHPIYGGNMQPHLKCSFDKLPFEDNSFSSLFALHVFEHTDTPHSTFQEWLRIAEKDAGIYLIMPDARYEDKLWDPSHKNCWTPMEFKKFLSGFAVDLIELDTFNNNFSFNIVCKKP